MSLNPATLGPRPINRPEGVSFRCHLAEVRAYLAHHRDCDGRSYTTSITDQGVPCTCTCHEPLPCSAD